MVLKLITSIKGFEESITHDSFENKKKNTIKKFQKYEFLGDRVLGLYVSQKIIKDDFKLLNDASNKFIYLTNKNTLSQVFDENNFQKIFKHKLDLKKDLTSTKSDFIESIIGFMYLKKGIRFTWSFLDIIFSKHLNVIAKKDPKTELQELFQKRFKKLPSYNLIKKQRINGQDQFTVQVFLKDIKVLAIGKSIKTAEINAANRLLKIIKKNFNFEA